MRACATFYSALGWPHDTTAGSDERFDRYRIGSFRHQLLPSDDGRYSASPFSRDKITLRVAARQCERKPSPCAFRWRRVIISSATLGDNLKCGRRADVRRPAAPRELLLIWARAMRHAASASPSSNRPFNRAVRLISAPIRFHRSRRHRRCASTSISW